MTKLRKGLAIILSLVLVITVIPAVSNNSEANAAETFTITSPTANQLVAAGYIDIEWEAATAGTVSNYDVFINGSKVTTTTSTSYEYYTTKVQAFDTYIKANYTNGTSDTTDVITFGVSKKGLGLAEDMGRNISLRDMGAAWYYNWGDTGPSLGEQYTGIEYVPMIWKETNSNNFKRRVESIKNKGYKYVLTFNEPDLGDQCNMSVDDVYNVWQGIADVTGIKVSSPVTATWPKASEWYQSFENKLDLSKDHDIDFVAIHCYPDDWNGGADMADWFLEEIVDWAWNEYKKPIWVTEFSSRGNGITNNKTKEFIERLLPELDKREYVERYAFFSFNSATFGGGLWNYSTGELTGAGEAYKTLGNPANFTPAVPPEPDYRVTTERRNELISDTKNINGVVCEDYVNASGVTATSDSEIGNGGRASLAIDNDADSRWESKHGVDPASLIIDLGTVRNIKEVDIWWENASASLYNIEVSTDGTTWITAAEGITGSGDRCDMVTLKSQVSARYVKIHGISRSTDYGYSIWDMAIYGSDDVKVDETTSKQPTTTTQAPTTTFEPVDVENETSETNMLSGLDWTTYVGTWAGANGTITEENGVVNGSFATTGGGHGEAIYGLQAQALDVVVEAGAEYTYSTKIKATKDMTIRFKITDGQAATETQLVFETINLKAGETYDYSVTFVAPSNEVDFVFALGGGTEGSTTDVSIGIASNNLIKIKDAPTTVAPITTEAPTTTVAPTTTTEVSGETTTVAKPKKAKIKKVYAKKKASKKVKLSIKKVKGAVGYQVAIYKTRKNAKKNKKALVKKIVRKRKVTITRKKLKNKKKLFVRVRAYKLNGKKKVWGKWSNIKKVKIKKS